MPSGYGDSDENRLYYDPTNNTLSGGTPYQGRQNDYTATQVRPNNGIPYPYTIDQTSTFPDYGFNEDNDPTCEEE